MSLEGQLRLCQGRAQGEFHPARIPLLVDGMDGNRMGQRIGKARAPIGRELAVIREFNTCLLFSFKSETGDHFQGARSPMGPGCPGQ